MTLDSITPLVQWITENPVWSGFIVFLISLSESLAVVGLLVPGVIMMTAIGSLIGAGKLPAIATMTWAILGAVAGDGLSYWLGHHYRDRLKYFWPFNKFPGWLERGNNFFKKHGGKSIILGRFVGPVRPTIPVIAGIMGMTPGTFLFFNIASAIAWAPLYCLPGMLIGVSLGQLSPKMASMVLSLVLALLFVLWLFFYCLLKFILYCKRVSSSFFRNSWIVWKQTNYLPWLQRLLTTAKDPNRGQLGTAFLLLSSLILFVYVVLCINLDFGIATWNETVHQVFRSLYTPWFAKWNIFIISFGEPLVLLSCVVSIGIYVLPRHKSSALCIIATFIISVALLHYCKFSIECMRPEGLVHVPDSHSFPSSSVLLATIVYSLLASFIRQVVIRDLRWIIWSILFFLIASISFAAMYLGLHWFTDIVGALALGVTCVCSGFFCYRHIVPDYPKLLTLLKPLVLSLLLAIPIYNLIAFKDNQAKWQRQWPVHTLNVMQWWQAHPLAEAIYRSSVLKRYNLPLDLHWLGNLAEISQTLSSLGWEALTPLNLESSLMLLSGTKSASLLPVLPKFHRDRLPALILTKILDPNGARLVLQLWASDYLTTKEIPLWVGTIRLETLVTKVPLISFYIEDPQNFSDKNYIWGLLKSIDTSGQWKYRRMHEPYAIYLIAPKK